MPSFVPLIASVVLAALPVWIWLNLIHREGEEKGLYVKTFLVGTLAVLPPFLLIFLFEKFPRLNVYSFIAANVSTVALAALFTNIMVGVVEEIAKNVIVRVIDRRHPEYLQTVASALKLSICAGLGFSFAENIFYFYNVWISPEYGAVDLFSTFIFRSVFTMCGHMVFSGIFGYYFGIGKFAADITEVQKWEGKGLGFARWVSRLTGRMTFQVVREIKNFQGLFLAMALHAMFNVSLDLEHKLPSILIVVGAAFYIVYLLQTKSGHLLFSMAKRKKSTMAQADEDVVIELLGMWSKEGRYKEVMEICDRLLLRDPDNNVVKLFRAKAGDNAELRQVYLALKGMFGPAGGHAVVSFASGASGKEKTLSVAEEKVVLEVMDKWYQEGNYKQVLEVANRLLARNPASQGAAVLLEKSMDREKMKRVFDALAGLFKE